MILNDFALLASNTARSKAYLQAMIQENRLPSMCIVYLDNILKLRKEAEQYKGKSGSEEYFDNNKPLLSFLIESAIQYILIEDKDINSKQMEEVLKGIQQKYIIYSGYGGYILKQHLFGLGKKFIHIHAGILPQYRGSTTIYYSYLQEKFFGATAIFMNEKIDEGEIIVQDIFGLPGQLVDLDYIYEPYLRSQVLIKAINKYISEGGFETNRQNDDNAETYFIIHPVLKHIALLGIEKEQTSGKVGGRCESSNIHPKGGDSRMLW